MKTNDQIRKLLSIIPELDHKAPLKFHYLAEGVTNENYWLNLGGKQFVLRINSPDSDRLGLSRIDEVRILKQVAANALAGKHTFYSQEKDFFLSEWLPGQIWDKADLEKPVQLIRLAQTLKRLHALPCHQFPSIDISGRLDLYRTMIRKRHGTLPNSEHRLLSHAMNLLDSMPHSLPTCLCHNDLLVANILTSNDPVSQHIYFLDWEYAAVNDPLFELAVICRGNQLSENNQKFLLQTYFGEETGLFISAFEYWCWIYEYLSLLWGLVILPEDIPLPDNLDKLLQQLMDKLP